MSEFLRSDPRRILRDHENSKCRSPGKIARAGLIWFVRGRIILQPNATLFEPAAFVVYIVVSVMDRSPRARLDRAGFTDQTRLMEGYTAIAVAE